MERLAKPGQDLSDIVIESERLTLKPISLDYVDDIFREFTPVVATYTYPQPNDDINRTIDWIKRCLSRLKNGSDLQMVAVNKEGEFLGYVALENLTTRTPELGIWLKESAHGHGFGSEAIGLLVDWANDNLDFDYLFYPVSKENIASRKVAEKNGGVLAGKRRTTNALGKELNEVIYHIFPKQS